MKARIVVKLFTDWEYTAFPTFPKGTPVKMAAEQDEFFLGWHEAEIEGHATFVPYHFVEEGLLTCDYNPTELRSNVGDMIEINEIHKTWLLATDQHGNQGWVPSLAVVSC